MKTNKKLTKREKLLICTAFVTTCAAGYFGYKYFSGAKFEELLNKSNKDLKESVDTLYSLILLYLPEYSNGTENRLKICRLNCLRVRIPSPVPIRHSSRLWLCREQVVLVPYPLSLLTMHK